MRGVLQNVEGGEAGARWLRTNPMLVEFFLHLKSFKLPVSTREFLTLLEALEQRVVSLSLDDFYALSRLCLVKDEQHFDRFDLAFGSYFKGIDGIFDIRAEIPEEWLRKEFLRHLSDEDKRLIESLGGLDKLLAIRRADHRDDAAFEDALQIVFPAH